MKEKITTLFESVDPEKQFFTEEHVTAFVSAIEESVKAETDALNEAHQAEIKRIDEEVTADIKKIDDEVIKDIQRLQEAFDVKLQKALAEQDADYTQDLKKVVEHIDADVCKKIKALNESFVATKAQEIEALKEKMLNESVDNTLMETIDEFLDLHLEESVPQPKEIDRLKLEKFESMFDNMKTLLSVNDDDAIASVKPAILEANEIINEKEKLLNESITESDKLKEQIKKLEADKLLNESVLSMNKAKREFIVKYVGEVTDKETVSTKIDEAKQAYDKQIVDIRDTKNKSEAPKVSLNIPTAPVNRKIVKESRPQDEAWDASFVNSIKRTNKK